MLFFRITSSFWLKTSGEDAPVETLLLDALKVVVDPDLRGRIEEALINRQRQISEKKCIDQNFYLQLSLNGSLEDKNSKCGHETQDKTKFY